MSRPAEGRQPGRDVEAGDLGPERDRAEDLGDPLVVVAELAPQRPRVRVAAEVAVVDGRDHPMARVLKPRKVDAKTKEVIALWSFRESRYSGSFANAL